MNCVVYARYSSERQNEQSIEGQLRVCNEYAAQRGWTVVHEYIDRAITGKTDRRPQFQRMILDADKGGWGAVIVYRFDRFARSRYDDTIYKKQLRDRGVDVLSATEALPPGAEGRLTEGVLVVLNEYFSEELAIKTRRGMRESAYKCHVTGQTPFGYRTGPEKEFLVDESEAEAVREIYRQYSAGVKYKDIIAWLQSHGYKTHSGKQFRITSLNAILRNEKYIGKYKYDDIEIDDGVPAILPMELWEAVRKKMGENKKAPAAKKAKVEYLLSGKTFCGYCHETVVGESGKSRGRTYNYYKCSGQKRKSGCGLKPVRKEILEDAVIRYTVNHVLDGEMIKTISLAVADEIKRRDADNSALEAAKKSLKEVEGGIENILRAIEAGIFTASTRDRLEELEKRKADLQATIERESGKVPALSAEQLQKFLSRFLGSSLSSPKDLKNLLDALIYRVYLYSGYCIVLYNITGLDPQTIDLDIEKIESEISKNSDLDSQGEPIEKLCKHFVYRAFCLLRVLKSFYKLIYSIWIIV